MKLKILIALIILLATFMFLPFGRYPALDDVRFDMVDALVRTKSHILSNYSHRNLSRKMNSPAPQWIQTRITSDLDYLSKKPITSKTLGDYMDQFSLQKLKNELLIIRRTLKNGEWHYFPKTLNRFRGRLTAIQIALDILNKEGLLPDHLDFILCINDKIFEAYKGDVPIFVFSKDTRTPEAKNLILIPDGMNLSRWAYVYPTICFANKVFPWTSKKDQVLWRGSNTNPIRLHASSTLRKNLTFLDAALTSGRDNAYMIPENQIQSKYLLSLDGISSTWPGLLWKLASNCLVLKQDSTHIQWYYDALHPYAHFVPVRQDLSDLQQRYHWIQTNSHEVKSIRYNAQKFIQENLMYEDMLHYMARVFREYKNVSKNPVLKAPQVFD